MIYRWYKSNARNSSKYKRNITTDSGRSGDFQEFGNKKHIAKFLIANEINILGFEDLFSTIDPALRLKDINDMLKERFNTPELIRKSILSWLMSSPMYETRIGGNAFSPISPADNSLKCDSSMNSLSDLKQYSQS